MSKGAQGWTRVDKGAQDDVQLKVKLHWHSCKFLIAGFFVGHEGPMFYIGAVIGSGVSQVRCLLL